MKKSFKKASPNGKKAYGVLVEQGPSQLVTDVLIFVGETCSEKRSFSAIRNYFVLFQRRGVAKVRKSYDNTEVKYFYPKYFILTLPNDDNLLIYKAPSLRRGLRISSLS